MNSFSYLRQMAPAKVHMGSCFRLSPITTDKNAARCRVDARR